MSGGGLAASRDLSRTEASPATVRSGMPTGPRIRHVVEQDRLTVLFDQVGDKTLPLGAVLAPNLLTVE